MSIEWKFGENESFPFSAEALRELVTGVRRSPRELYQALLNKYPQATPEGIAVVD